MREFLNIDCMDEKRGLPSYADNHFDLAICDPPYGLGDFTKTADGWKGIAKKNWSIKWNDKIPESKYFKELYRISKNRIIWGCNYYSQYISDIGRIVFDKTDGGIAGLDFSDCDLASNSIHRNIKAYRLKWMGIMKGKEAALENRIHPCQKPVALYRWLLENYAKEGDLILDTHVGSASSLIACEALGFDYVGYEIDADYYEAATKRIKEWRSLPLFEQPKEPEQLRMEV